jgi:spermidine synthase
LNFGAGLLALVLTPLLDRTPPPVVESAPVGDRPPEEEGDSPPPEILPGDEATPGPSDSGRQDADRRSLAIWILATAFASGVVALAAQIVWNRMLVFNFEYLKNTTYAFSAMLTIFLAGLALGSAIIGPLVDRHGEPLRLYGILLTLIGMAVGASAVAAVYGTDSLMLADPYDPVTDELSWVLAVANIMLQTIGVLGVPTLLMGMAFPVAARVFARVGTIGGDVGLLYSFNTVGAIFGSLLAALVLIPAMGLTRSLLVLGGIDVVLGLATIVRSPEGRSRAWVLGPLSVASMFGVLWIVSGPQVGRLQRLDRGEAIRFYKEGSLATVSVVENVIGERTLYVDGVGVAGTDPILETDQKSLAHVPMMLLANPTSALTVGFGSGGASYSLLLHDRLERIDCVEICQTVFDAAPALAATNHRFYRDMTPLAFAESDPRYNIVLDDARAWLRYTDSKYDFIATDCTDLRYKSNANLYDVEYFRACRNRLTEDGIVVVWMPLGGLSEDVFKIALRTFYEVFPQMGIFSMNTESTHYILLVGWQDRIRLDFRQFELSLREADVKQDLSILRLDDPVKLLSCFITGGEALGKWLGEGPLNTEDHPLIEFESPKYGFGDRPLLDNLDRLMEIRVTPRQFIDPTSLTTDALEQLERYERALPLIIEGHAHYRNIEAEGIFEALEAAALAWSKALVLAPEDLSLRRMLQFPIVSKRMELEENNPLWAMLFGRVYMVQVGAFKQDLAYDALRRAERLLRAQRNLIGEGDTTAVDGQLSLVQEWLDQIRKGG